MVTLYDKIYFLTKDGTVLQAIETLDFFGPLTASINASLNPPLGLSKSIWGIDKYYDARAIFDPFRSRFWIGALAVNSQTPSSSDPTISGARRGRFVVGVSVSENPQDGWYLYWWNAVVNDGGCTPNCTSQYAADYPSLGISKDYFVEENTAGKKKPAPSEYYRHIVAVPAAVLAAGAFCNPCQAWEIWNAKEPDGCPATSIIQPAVQQSDFFGGSLFVSNFVYPKDARCAGGSTRADNAADKYNVVAWLLLIGSGPPDLSNVAVPVKKFGGNPTRPGYAAGYLAGNPNAAVGQMEAEQQPNAAVPTPNFVKIANTGNSTMKTVFRNNLLHAVWQDCVAWENAPTCYTSIRLVRVSPISPTSAFIDRSFGLRNVFDDGPTDFVYYGVPAVEANRDGNMAVVYIRSGQTVFPQARYSVYFDSDTDVLPSRALQVGDFPLGSNATPGQEVQIGNLDVGGIGVDPFDDTGIWMAHGYSTQNTNTSGKWQLAVGKVFGHVWPDFVLTNVGVSSSRVRRGEPLEVTLALRNQGDGSSAATVARVFLVPVGARDTTGVRIAALSVGPLASGAQTTLATMAVIPASTPPGAYHLEAVVDPDDVVTEYSETNNTWSSGIVQVSAR